MKHCRTAIVIPAFTLALIGLTTSELWAGKPTPPPPPTPCTGSPIQVNDSSLCGVTKWIEVTDSATVCTIKCFQQKALGGANRKLDCGMLMIGWIGGTVIADPSAELGFRFDPASVVVAEVTAEGMQTTLCAIRDNPAMFDGGMWYVGYIPVGIQDM